MTLQEIFDHLTHGELSQLNIGGAQSGGAIDPANYGIVLSQVNMALLALYTRFRLKQNRVTFRLIPGKETYTLSANSDLYIVNTDYADDFADDILKVEELITDKGFSLDLRNPSNKMSVGFPTSTTLRLPAMLAAQGQYLQDTYRTETLTAVYRARHPLVSLSVRVTDPAKLELELPYTHLTPLLLHIASRMHNPIGMTNEFHAGNSYYAKYEQACMELEAHDYQGSKGQENDLLRSRGWV